MTKAGVRKGTRLEHSCQGFQSSQVAGTHTEHGQGACLDWGLFGLHILARREKTLLRRIDKAFHALHGERMVEEGVARSPRSGERCRPRLLRFGHVEDRRSRQSVLRQGRRPAPACPKYHSPLPRERRSASLGRFTPKTIDLLAAWSNSDGPPSQLEQGTHLPSHAVALADMSQINRCAGYFRKFVARRSTTVTGRLRNAPPKPHLQGSSDPAKA